MERIECVTLVYRLSPLTTPPVEKSPIMNLTLQEILIIGNCSDQVVYEVDTDTHTCTHVCTCENISDTYVHTYHLCFHTSYSILSN
jgi:hypothetical protein